jgi:uncharacterized protein (TIGR03435 family)
MARRLAPTLMLIVSWQAYSQPRESQPEFEVASVRVNDTRVRGSIEFSRSGERFTATNMPLGAIVVIAYGITVRQLSGPDDSLSMRYDIAAKAERPVGAREMMRMLQSLLGERFKMIVRRETKEVPVYALTIAKPDPRLQRSESADDEVARPRTPSAAGGTESAAGRLVFRNESMPDFAWALSRMAGIGDRVVVDETGLPGRFDFELTVERENVMAAGPDVRDPAPRLGALESALERQLGLKLESKKAPVEFVIIDHVEKPSAN